MSMTGVILLGLLGFIVIVAVWTVIARHRSIQRRRDRWLMGQDR